MKIRYSLYFVITSFFNILFWYYVIAFCGVYVTSSSGWIYGSFTGIILDWFFISILIPLVRTFLRVGIRKYRKLRFLVVLEYIIWTLKNLCG
jgi:hypothetical protein